VFVVGHLGDWRRAAAVLFERQSLRRDIAPSRKAGQKVAPTVVQGPPYSRTGNERVECDAIVAQCLTTGVGQRYDPETETILPVALAENTIGRQPQNGGNGDGFTVGGPMCTLNATGVHGVAQVVHGTQDPCVSDIAFAQGRNNGGENVVVYRMAVRRLTPTECERLQGFPDGYTDIKTNGKPTPDGPRYKALGNSMAVPVMRWIGERINNA
jgi:DNA (cytosine-5)-methyltransferase 1